MAEELIQQELKRSAHLFYLNATPNAETPSWFLVYKKIDDMSVELNPNTETIKNILDETDIVDNGYEPSISEVPYYANPKDGDFYTFISDIAFKRLTGDDCMTECLEVIVDRKTGPYRAFREKAMVKPQSYGGAQGGMRIPYSVSFCGDRTEGTATISADKKTPVFTETVSE